MCCMLYHLLVTVTKPSQLVNRKDLVLLLHSGFQDTYMQLNQR